MTLGFDPLPELRVPAASVLPTWFIDACSQSPTSQLELCFQPLIDLGTRSMIGAEALLRWHGHDGLLGNNDWIPAAECANLMAGVDRWVLKAAMHATAEFQTAQSGFVVAVNVSPDNLTATMSRQAAQLARELEVTPKSVHLEITETAAATDPDVAQRAVTELREAGFGVVLDDFGTGQSTFEQFLALEITGLKLDRAFTSTLDTRKGRAVAQLLSQMARDLGLICVAEGVELDEEEAALIALGYQVGQGWLYAPALPADQIHSSLRRAA